MKKYLPIKTFTGMFPRLPDRSIDSTVMVDDIRKILATLESCECNHNHVQVVNKMVDKFRVKWEHVDERKFFGLLLDSLRAKVAAKRVEVISQLN